jgi:hypothetical protein
MSFSLGGHVTRSTQPSEPGQDLSPPASRAGARRLRDVRLWIGVLLVAVSALVGGRVLAAADDTVEVWTAAHDLPAGAELAAADLVATSVHFADSSAADAYLHAGSSIAGSQLAQPVGAGQLIPSSAIGGAGEPASEMPVGVAAADLPPDLAPGDRVDVWAVPSEGRRGAVSQVMRDVHVVDVSDPAIAAAGGDREVLIAVAADADVQAALVQLSDARPVLVRVGG